MLIMNINQTTSLPLESKFAIQIFTNQVNELTGDQAKELCVNLYEQLIVQERLYRQLMSSNWFSPKS